MNEECLNHGYNGLNMDYINQLGDKYNTNNLDVIAKMERKEIGESGLVGKFLKYKCKLKKN
jgi:hypothetical protein